MNLKRTRNKSRISDSWLLDEMCLQVSPKHYGKFWLRDTNSWLEFRANAYIIMGDTATYEVDVDCISDDRRAGQLCYSEDFIRMCKGAILDEYPENIDGFDDLVEEYGYDDAIDCLSAQVDSVDTYSKYNKRFSENMAQSSKDFYNAEYGW